MENLFIMNEVYIFIIIFGGFYEKIIWNIVESNFGLDGGGINLYVEWLCNFYDSILFLIL